VARLFKMCIPVLNSDLEVRSSGRVCCVELYCLDLTSGSGFATVTGNTKHWSFCLDHTWAVSAKDCSSILMFSVIHFWSCSEVKLLALSWNIRCVWWSVQKCMNKKWIEHQNSSGCLTHGHVNHVVIWEGNAEVASSSEKTWISLLKWLKWRFCSMSNIAHEDLSSMLCT